MPFLLRIYTTDNTSLKTVKCMESIQKIKINPKELEIINAVHTLSKHIFEFQTGRDLERIPNKGKRIRAAVSASLLLDTQMAFEEFITILHDKCSQYMPVSFSLLGRYILENQLTFLYIFHNHSSGETQRRANLFFHFGEYKRKTLRGKKEDPTLDKIEWQKHFKKSEQGNKTQWHGKSFVELAEAVGFDPNVYKMMSQFTHPGIFNAERVYNTDMFRGISALHPLYTAGNLVVMLDIALEKRLYGVAFKRKDIEKIKKEIGRLSNEIGIHIKNTKD